MSSPDRRIHDGRVVITRTELLRLAGVGPSTAEAWYRDRARNGYPAPVLAVGRRLFFDEAALLAWVHSHRHPEPAPARIVRAGRVLVTRAELARRTGLSEAALTSLYARRATNRHPQAAHRDRRALYFDEIDAMAWHAARSGSVQPDARRRTG